MLEVKNLSKVYKIGKELRYAVKNVSFSLAKGDILGLVGESGCGKSTLGRMLLGLTPPTEGEVFFCGKKIIKNVPTCMQMIFQDSFASLNPRMTIGNIISEPLEIHGRPCRIDELLDLVGLHLNTKSRFPHELSGGQRQRVDIARALALHPDFIVCDEPIASLDVSIQAQIVNLLLKLQKDLNLTYLFIAHDLAMIRHISTQIAVMYQGEFVECASSQTLYEKCSHPYTRLLFSSLPLGTSDGETAYRAATFHHNSCNLQAHSSPRCEIESTPSQAGCPFAHRCPWKAPLCLAQKPDLKEIDPEHFVACHFAKRFKALA